MKKSHIQITPSRLRVFYIDNFFSHEPQLDGTFKDVFEKARILRAILWANLLEETKQ